jgi:hypothetical protein
MHRARAPVFVVGCGHSGTTELISLLSRHPLVYAYLEGPGMEFAVQSNSFGAAPFPLGWVPSRRDDLAFGDLATAAKPGSRWAVKSPSNVCRLGYIWQTLPWARVVMTVRDGRDAFLSLRERYPDADADGPLVLGRW